MSDDSDQEYSELDIERKTFTRLEENMKSIGFREGSAEGKSLSIQEGFNLGYLDGFKVGEYIGIIEVINNCESELELPSTKSCFPEEAMEILSSEPCILCTEKKRPKESIEQDNSIKDFEDLVSRQHNHITKIMDVLKKSTLKSFLDQG